MKTYSRRKYSSKYDFGELSVDFKTVCRLCLSEEGEKMPIFEEDGGVPLPLRIMACVSVEVFEGDGLPSQICQECYEQVDISYQFRQKCEESDSKLRYFLKHVGTPANTDSKSAEDTVLEAEAAVHEITLPEAHPRRNREEHQRNVKKLFKDWLDDSMLDKDASISVISNENENPVIHNLDKERQDLLVTDCESRQEVTLCEEGRIYTQLGGQPTLTPQNCEPMTYEKENPPQLTTLEQLPVKMEHQEYAVQQNPTEQHNSEGNNVLNVHHLEHMVNQGMPFACTKCPKRFAKRIDLRRHESVHDQQRGFECPVCEKWFPNKTSYNRHERTHTGERPYACSICGKSFSQGAILARHIMTHTGIKPFKCNECNKSFTQRESLRVHMRQHSNDQPEIQLHECPLCEKSFCHPSGLSRHLIVHTGKTFDCSYCPKVFTDSSSLKRHLKRHRQLEPQLNQSDSKM